MKWKKNVLKIVCLLVVLVLSIGTIWDFTLQLQGTLTRETYATLADVSEDYNKAFSDRVSYNIQTMNVLAGSLEGMHAMTKEDIIYILQNAVKNGDFEKMVVCDENGVAWSNEGVSRNVSSRDYFKKAIAGEATVSEPLISVVDGEESIVIAVPIAKDNKTKGVLFGVYPLATAGNQLLNFTYYSEGYGFIVAPDGTVLISNEHIDKLADEKNLFEFFKKTEFVNFSIDKLKAAMEKGESRSFEFKYNGERRFVSFTPSTVNNWYTFSISSDAVLQQREKNTNTIVIRLIIRLLMAGLLMFLWIALRNRRHNEEIVMANRKYQSLLDHINGGLIVAVNAGTPDKIIATYVSQGFTDMTGYTLLDIQSIYSGCYVNLILEADRKNAFDSHVVQLKEGNTYRVSYRILKKDGSILWVMDNGYLVEDEDGLSNHSIITDITIIKQQEEELRMSEKRFSIAVNASSGALFEVDLKSQLYTHFENAERIFGVSAEKLMEDTREFAGLSFGEFVDAITTYFFHPDYRELAKSEMAELIKNRVTSYESRIRRFDGSYIWCRVDLSLTFDEFGAPACLVGFMSDIDDIKKQSEALENKVQVDPMTGLYNKIAMATLSNKALSECQSGRHALIVLDIDDFKGINDTLGHAFGDLVLIEASTKMKTMFRNNDIVGRMGGDEFAIFMKNVPDTANVLKKATELSGAFRQTYIGAKEDYKISCSIGIIMIEDNNDTFEKLYRKADAALYMAKENGKDQFVFYAEKDAENYPIESIRTNDEELQNLRAEHNIESHIFELLYTSKDFNISINMALAAIGQQYNVSRVAIFENDEENLTTSNIHEWCNEGVPAAIDNIQNMFLSEGNESVLDCFDQDGLLYCNDRRELSPYPRRLLEEQGVLSTLKVIITNDEKICGFIGFDECSKYRIWTSEEIEKLSFLAKVISVFLFKQKAELSLVSNLQTRLKILDTLPNYICVVNPETHMVEYANQKMHQILPSAYPGAFCFNTLRGGQNAPCETCLVERIKRGDTDNLEIISEDKNLRLKVNALSINWTNDRKMVLLYGAEKTVNI